LRRGDVVLMVVPGELGRPRPGVIVQSDELGDATTTVLICPMTSDIQANTRMRPVVDPASGNGLRLPSQVMTDKLLPLRRDRVRQVLGRLDPDAIEQLDRALLTVLALGV
jgi:mRNA interferase MazF